MGLNSRRRLDRRPALPRRRGTAAAVASLRLPVACHAAGASHALSRARSLACDGAAQRAVPLPRGCLLGVGCTEVNSHRSFREIRARWTVIPVGLTIDRYSYLRISCYPRSSISKGMMDARNAGEELETGWTKSDRISRRNRLLVCGFVGPRGILNFTRRKPVAMPAHVVQSTDSRV